MQDLQENSCSDGKEMTEQFWIRWLNPVESIMSAPLYKELKNELSFRAVYYQPGPFQKTRKEYMKSSFIGHNKDGWFFYTGFFPRILAFCEKHKIKIESDYETYGLIYQEPETPDDFDARTFQKSMVTTFIENERGVLIAPTGVGKTSLGLYTIASCKGLGNIIWLSHTKDLMHQSAKEAEKWFGKRNVGRAGDGHLELGRFFTSATRQTFREHAEEWGIVYDMVVLDEVQHLSAFPEIDKYGKELNEYGQIFKRIYAPVRLGLTATMPDKNEANLAIEGMIGPILEQFEDAQAEEEGYIVKPTVKILKVSRSENIRILHKYSDVEEWGIVRRLERNQIILDKVVEHQAKNESVLIVVKKVIHGQLLEKLGLKRGLEIKFVYGNTDTETRDLTKQLLNDKKMKCVVCTIWKEGTNIPELDVVINAAGGKSELATIQIIGRGRRKTKTKLGLIVYDIFDPSHTYLVDHFGFRFSYYCERGWV